MEPKVCAARTDAREAARLGPGSEERGLRYSRPCLAAWSTPLSTARYVESRCGLPLPSVLARSRAAAYRRSSGTSREFWLSSMGPDDTLPVDETLECLRRKRGASRG